MADFQSTSLPPEGINRDNFHDLMREVQCQGCQRKGMWELEPVVNNGGARLKCRCGRLPWPTHFVKKAESFARRKPIGISTPAFWEDHGNYCYGCGNDYGVLQALGIAAHIHHTVPYCRAGHDGAKIPLCALCHQVITPIQQSVAGRFRELVALRMEIDHPDDTL